MSNFQLSLPGGASKMNGTDNDNSQVSLFDATGQNHLTPDSLLVDGSLVTDASQNIPQVHPVLVIVVGTTEAELTLLLHSHFDGTGGLVPWRGVLIDSLPYDDIVTRLEHNGWSKGQAHRALPRSHYFQLASPFAVDFDLAHPLNQEWRATFFEPSLERLAKKPDEPGCAGTPALGRARVEGNEHELRAFLERHVQEFTQVSPQNMALLPGIKVFVETTCRGGTGTGAATLVAAILRTIIATNGEIHLRCLMPCVYRGDERARANAFAMLRENQYYHRYGGRVPIKGNRTLQAPFNTASYTFSSNDAVTLGHKDALMQEVAILGTYLRAATQSAVHARLVDLTDVTPYDLHDLPMHVRVETATSIQTVLPGTQEYLATEWVRQEIEGVRERFEAWCRTKELSREEQTRLEAIVQTAIKELNLDLDALLTRLDPSPAPANHLRSFFEQANGMIGSMQAKAIKQSIGDVPMRVREAFVKFEAVWEERTSLLATALPREIVSYVMSRLGSVPHLALATLEQIHAHLAGVAKEAETEAKAAKKTRDTAGAQLGPTIQEVTEAGGILGFFKADEVTRDAAYRALNVAVQAASARVQQEKLECLAKALRGEISTRDNHGNPGTLPSVTVALQNFRVEQIGIVNTHQQQWLSDLQIRLQDLGQRIEKRSPVFQRAVLYDRMSRKHLDAEVRRSREKLPVVPPIERFLASKQSLQQTITELLPLLPSYTESCRSLTEILTRDLGKQKLVLQILRGLTPFTPLDREVEDHQGLRNRRDTLVILEVPDGPDSPLGQLMLREGIVTSQNHLVDSGEDEIRLHYLRDGLPYAALYPLRQYQHLHDQYLARPDAITPYTIAGAHQFPKIEPSRINLRLHTEQLLYVAKAVLPDRLSVKPSGGFTLRYEQDTGYDFAATRQEEFPDFETLVVWIAKRVQILRALEAALKQLLDADAVAYKTKLVAAWQRAVGRERDCLQGVLFSLQVDPTKFIAADLRKQSAKRSSRGVDKTRTQRR